MSCCCNKILELCNVPVCGTAMINTGVDAPASGTYYLILDYIGIQVVLESTLLVDEELSFPAKDLNENYKYTGRIINQAGEQISMVVDTVQYDCISFKTVMQYTIPAEEVTP